MTTQFKLSHEIARRRASGVGACIVTSPTESNRKRDQRIEKEALHSLADISQVIYAPARLMVLSYLYVVESADFIFLKSMTGLTWGNLSTHLSKLEEAGYVAIEKEYKGKEPHTMIRLTDPGWEAFREYMKSLQQVLDDLLD